MHFSAWVLLVKTSAQYVPINPKIARMLLSLMIVMTHPAHSFKMVAVSLEVDELAVECPRERNIQSWITGNLAG